MSEYEEIDPSALGPNMWLVDEMYRRYRENPEAVDERWREFFEDFRPRLGEGESSGRTTAASKEAPGARKVTIPEGAERIRFAAEWQGADPSTLATLGVGKLIGVTSTYDHRVIQGAESGLFLAKLEELLRGGDDFYEDVFASLRAPYEPVRG